MTHVRKLRCLRAELLDARQLLAADVAITEFMSRNATSLVDSYGDHSDWIELHNSGDETADIAGFSLTDDLEQPTRWRFPPATTILPDEYLVVFASGRDEVTTDGELHTNFKLDGDGETLALVNLSQQIISSFGQSAAPYPSQREDISYGPGGDFIQQRAEDTQTISATTTSTQVSRLEVAATPGTIADINVSLDISHTWNSDLDVFLISPAGTRVELFTDVGSSSDDLLGTVLDDEAEQSITTGTGPFKGRFRPEGNLSAFDGESPTGAWLLEVSDDFAREGGTIHGWGIEIELSDTAGADIVGFMTHPTPGGPNSPAVAGVTEGVEFSIERGYYDAPSFVELMSPTPDATIYYTTDGSEPLPGDDSTFTYAAPIALTHTTTLRAAALRTAWLISPSVTQTYLFVTDIIQQPAAPVGYPLTWNGRSVIDADYEMDPEIITNPLYATQMTTALTSHPVMSLTMDIDDWFDAKSGIYANSEESGAAWEREVSVELFGFDHGQTVQLQAGIRMQGNASRWPSRPKHNMRLAFRSQYGAGQLKFPLFDDTDIERFNGIVLRGGNGDAWINSTTNQRAAYIRDQWHRDMQRAMGHETSLQRYAQLYINGMYWGLYHLFERVDDQFMAAHFGGQADNYDVIKDIRNTGGRVEAISGSTDAWDELVRRAETDLSEQTNYAALLEYLDVENFIDYMLLNFYSGNQDWDRSNWRAARDRNDGQFKFFSWDAERTDLNTVAAEGQLGSVTINTTNTVNPNYPTYIHNRLLDSTEYRLLFADRMQRHLFGEGVLTPKSAARLWNDRADEIRQAIIAESARWGDAHVSAPRTQATWEQHNRDMNARWFPRRTEVLVSQLQRQGLYTSLTAPTVELTTALAPWGHTLSMTAPPATVIYFTLDGSDPRVAGGDVSPAAIAYQVPLTLTTNDVLLARTYDAGEWSALVELTGARLPFPDRNQDGTLTAFDLTMLCAAIRREDPTADLNGDGDETRDDLDYMVRDILHTSAGDANLDGHFDSQDLVLIFQAGKFETTAAVDSGWQEGDWNCDGLFTTSDLVLAFQSGRYQLN
ncbi:MAG: CotH kinase family protein [Planctomycetales bacterium]|nr:CotH kinase family protein [Planctomycetales bacterium]